MTKVRKTFTLDPDLVDYLAQQANASDIVNAALRDYITHIRPPTTLEQVLEAINDLRADISIGGIVIAEQTAAHEDPVLSAALDNLGM